MTFTLLLFFLVFEEEVLLFASVKLSPTGTIRDHFQLALNSIRIFVDHPFGLGYNNFSFAYEFFFKEKNYNTHNSWITYLTEIGLVGLVYQLMFSIYLLASCIRLKTPLSMVFIVSYLAMCFAALGYEVKNQFFFNLFTTLFFSILIIEGYRRKAAMFLR